MYKSYNEYNVARFKAIIRKLNRKIKTAKGTAPGSHRHLALAESQLAISQKKVEDERKH